MITVDGRVSVVPLPACNYLNHELLNRLTAMSPFLFLTSGQHEAGTWDPNYTPGVDFLTMIFYNLKNSHQDLSNEGSNFILSSLEVGH